MKRRDFLALAATAGAATAFPSISLGQQNAPKAARVALLSSTVPATQMTSSGSPRWAAFLDELAHLGFVEGTNLAVERYSGNGDPATYTSVTNLAVSTNPDLIYVGASAPMSQAAVAATKTVPIVFLTDDGLNRGLVPNLNQPGGNVTGVNTLAGLSGSEEGKRLQLLHEAVPRAHRIACLASAAAWATSGLTVVDAAARFGLEIELLTADAPIGEASYRKAFAAMSEKKIEAVLLMSSPENSTFGGLIGGFAAANHVPGLSFEAGFVDGGGLMSYGANLNILWRQAAGYVALVLKGAKPGDLAVVQPAIYDFAVNLRAAKELGLEMPLSIIASATELRQ